MKQGKKLVIRGIQIQLPPTHNLVTFGRTATIGDLLGTGGGPIRVNGEDRCDLIFCEEERTSDRTRGECTALFPSFSSTFSIDRFNAPTFVKIALNFTPSASISCSCMSNAPLWFSARSMPRCRCSI